MIRNQFEYRNCVINYYHYLGSIERYREAMERASFTLEQIERGLEPVLSYQVKLEQELSEWEQTVAQALSSSGGDEVTQ